MTGRLTRYQHLRVELFGETACPFVSSLDTMIMQVVKTHPPVKFRSDWKSLNLNLLSSRLHEILRYDSVRLVNRGPDDTKSEFINNHGLVVFTLFAVFRYHMMTPSNGNIFRFTGSLWGEFTGHRRCVVLMFCLIWTWTDGWVNNRDPVIWDTLAPIMRSL